MRRIFWSQMVSLDGLSEGPDGELDWHAIDDDFMSYVHGMLGKIDSILLGRVTYSHFAQYWPNANNAEATRMNDLEKLVVSTTLEKVEWQGSRLVKIEELAEIKQGPGRDIAIFGSSTLASSLLKLGLIDELRIFTTPVVLGAGKPMIRDVGERVNLRHVDSRVLGSGVVMSTYRT